MDPSTIFNMVLSMTILILFILTTVNLYLRMKKIKLSNLIWLVGFFFSKSLVGLSKAMGNDILFYIVEGASLIFLIFFTKETFYKEQHTFFSLIFAASLILWISGFIFMLLKLIDYSGLLYLIEVALLSSLILIASLWNGLTSISTYNNIKEENIDKNIKLRFKIIGISSIIFSLQGIFTPIHAHLQVSASPGIYEISSRIYTLINVIILFLFAVGNYYTWITLSGKLEKSINVFELASEEKEEVSELIQEINEKESIKIPIMNPITYFGDLLAQKIGKLELASRGLILYAIRDEMGSYDTLNFDVLKQTFENSLQN